MPNDVTTKPHHHASVHKTTVLPLAFCTYDEHSIKGLTGGGFRCALRLDCYDCSVVIKFWFLCIQFLWHAVSDVRSLGTVPVLIVLVIPAQNFQSELFIQCTWNPGPCYCYRITMHIIIITTMRCSIVQSAVLQSYVVHLSARPSVRWWIVNLWSHRLEIFETNCTDN